LDTHVRCGKAKKASGSTKCHVDLYGVAIGFSAPTLTTRGDQMLTVTLMDETICDGDGAQEPSPVTLVIFCNPKKSLPVFSCAGNILRLHRVVVQVRTVATLCSLAPWYVQVLILHGPF
jgi:Telomeric single stranded DNA binding POT1/CDC13